MDEGHMWALAGVMVLLAMGVLALAWNGAGIVGPQLGFRLFAIDPALVWLMCGLLGMLAAGVILRGGRWREEKF